MDSMKVSRELQVVTTKGFREGGDTRKFKAATWMILIHEGLTHLQHRPRNMTSWMRSII